MKENKNASIVKETQKEIKTEIKKNIDTQKKTKAEYLLS